MNHHAKKCALRATELAAHRSSLSTAEIIMLHPRALLVLSLAAGVAAAHQPPVLPGYNIIGEIAAGAQGVVWLAVDRTTGLAVAIKELWASSSKRRDACERAKCV